MTDMTDEPLISTTIDRSRHTILVVDDNPATRYATARVIRAAGFKTAEVATGGEALAMASQQISAVVLDVHLPDIDGFEVCRELRLRSSTATLPIVHLSATFVRNEDKVAGLNAGADAYLVHPVEPPVLIATLQALIRARLAEERQRSSEARFRAIYDQAPIGIALVDNAGRFADVNPAMTGMLGWPRETLVGHAIAEFAPAEWVAFVNERFTGQHEPAAPSHTEFPLTREDGRTIRLEWTLSTHIEPGLSVGIAIDVSERFEFETRRREVLEREQAARAAAERLSRTKDDFVAVLSHELRNPLNAIGGWVHLLRTGIRTTEQMEKGLNAIDRSVKSQARLISDILDVSRVSSGKLRLNREWVEPGALVSTAIEALDGAAAARRVSIHFVNEGREEPAWLDGMRFQQIVWNLLSNAIKFSDEEGRVLVGLTRHNERLRLSVQDFGRGIAPDFLPHLFDRFTQSDSPDNRVHGGLGLGLSIVKNLAELHGGSVTAASEGAGKGATLSVELNVMPSGDASIILLDELNALAAGPESATLTDLDVLVVEDNADAREILSVVLSDAGADVRIAADYDSALQQIGTRWPKVLICDIGLPGRDGYELIRAVRQIENAQGRPKLFAVAHTAFTRPQDHSRATEAGFDIHLPKPLQPHVLLGLIQSRPPRQPGI